MTVDEVFNYFGSNVAIAKALGMTRNTPLYWRRVGYVPMYIQLRLEIITNGKLQRSR